MRTDRIIIPPKTLLETIDLVKGIASVYKGLPIGEIRIVAQESEALVTGEDTPINYVTQLLMFELVDVNIEWNLE